METEEQRKMFCDRWGHACVHDVETWSSFAMLSDGKLRMSVLSLRSGVRFMGAALPWTYVFVGVSCLGTVGPNGRDLNRDCVCKLHPGPQIY